MVMKPIPQYPIFRADALLLSSCDEILPVISFVTLVAPFDRGNVVDFIVPYLWLLFDNFVYLWACFLVLLVRSVAYRGNFRFECLSPMLK